MLSDDDTGSEQLGQFLDIMKQQLRKLEFLLDALIKSSRLETEMINLEPENGRVIETLAVAVNGVMHKAEDKNINSSVVCPSFVRVYHDMKWTAEALENKLDNAVKYTPTNGKSSVRSEEGKGSCFSVCLPNRP